MNNKQKIVLPINISLFVFFSAVLVVLPLGLNIFAFFEFNKTNPNTFFFISLITAIVLAFIYVFVIIIVLQKGGTHFCREFPGEYLCKLQNDERYCSQEFRINTVNSENFLEVCREFGTLAKHNIFMTLPKNPYDDISNNLGSDEDFKKFLRNYTTVRDNPLYRKGIRKKGLKTKQIYLTEQQIKTFFKNFIDDFNQTHYNRKNRLPFFFYNTNFTKYIKAHQDNSSYPIEIMWLRVKQEVLANKEEKIIFDNRIKIIEKDSDIIINYGSSVTPQELRLNMIALNTYDFLKNLIIKNKDILDVKLQREMLYEIEKYKIRRYFKIPRMLFNSYLRDMHLLYD